MITSPLSLLFLYLTFITSFAFILCGIDKRKAIKGSWRIPERRLLTAGLLGGCFGLFFAMKLFRHKTQHKKFIFLVPIQCLLWVGIIGYSFYSIRSGQLEGIQLWW